MKKLLMVLLIVGMLIGAGCKEEVESLEQIKARVQAEIPEEAEPDAKIVAAWRIAYRTAAKYKLAGDQQNYLIWKREARRLAILLGY